MPKILNAKNPAHLQAIYLVGIFGSFGSKRGQFSFLESLRDILRQDGYLSAFIAKDYLKIKGETTTDKCLDILRACHLPIFNFTENMGRGGTLIEFTEFMKMAQVDRRKSIILETCKYINGVLFEEPTEMIEKYLKNDTSLDVIRYFDESEVERYITGQVNKYFHVDLKKPLLLMDEPARRLTCQLCNLRPSYYLCIDKCKTSCKKTHLCPVCVGVNIKKTEKKCKIHPFPIDNLYMYPE